MSTSSRAGSSTTPGCSTSPRGTSEARSRYRSPPARQPVSVGRQAARPTAPGSHRAWRLRARRLGARRATPVVHRSLSSSDAPIRMRIFGDVEIEGVWKLCEESCLTCAGNGLSGLWDELWMNCVRRGSAHGVRAESPSSPRILSTSSSCGLVGEQASAHLAVRVQDGGVVAASEPLADRGKREVGQLAAEVHRHLASINNLAAAFGRAEVGLVEQLECAGRGLLDLLDGGPGRRSADRRGGCVEVREHVLDERRS